MACGCSTGCTGACEGGSFATRGIAGSAGARLSSMWDRARDMKVRAGLRPYEVAIVRARASSARRRGDGPNEIVGEWKILPVPKVGDLTSITDIVSADQVREMGVIVLSEISLCYSENVLLGRGPEGRSIPPDEIVFYEIRALDRAGNVTSARRFTPSSPPYADYERAQWTISLTRAHHDRDRNGVLR